GHAGDSRPNGGAGARVNGWKVSPLLTTEDSEGGMRFRALAIPLIIAVICASIVAGMALSGVVGAGLGMAIGAAAATGLIVFAARARPGGRLEVADSGDEEHRVLVIATAEASEVSAERIAALAGSASDIRVVVPVPSDPLDRWLSAEDDARR